MERIEAQASMTSRMGIQYWVVDTMTANMNGIAFEALQTSMPQPCPCGSASMSLNMG